MKEPGYVVFTVTIRLDAEDYEKLEALAQAMGMTRDEITGVAVTRSLMTFEDPELLAREVKRILLEEMR